MIRLRRMLECGRAHPVLGPLVLVVVVLLLAIVLWHLADEGWEAAVTVGAICFAVAMVVGPIVLERIQRRVSTVPVALRERGPPRLRRVRPFLAAALPTETRNLPLRR